MARTWRESSAPASRTRIRTLVKSDDHADGMCPDIWLYDFRVLAPDLKDTEFAIMGALQYIRYMNERNRFIAIHGANLSLSIPHDVRNFACGRTPVCEECERLVESGVVVVAAAGNHGYQNFETKEGIYEGYAAFSITDPGNSDGVITVGATHRYWPHTYGVSFFSSRGPTGDGRLKPDLVAPGERIRAPMLEAALGRSRRHEHGGAARQRSRSHAHGALFGTHRPAQEDQAHSVRKRDRSRSRTELPRAWHARRAPSVSKHLRKKTMIFSLEVRRARKGDCLLLHFGPKDDPGLDHDRWRAEEAFTSRTSNHASKRSELLVAFPTRIHFPSTC